MEVKRMWSLVRHEIFRLPSGVLRLPYALMKTTKQLGFAPSNQALVISGAKTTTWRCFDDKNLTKGDVIEFVDQFTRVPFAVAKLTNIREKTFGEVTPEDQMGSVLFSSDEDMYRTYSGYYERVVGPETPIKIIRFKLIKKIVK